MHAIIISHDIILFLNWVWHWYHCYGNNYHLNLTDMFCATSLVLCLEMRNVQLHGSTSVQHQHMQFVVHTHTVGIIYQSVI